MSEGVGLNLRGMAFLNTCTFQQFGINLAIRYEFKRVIFFRATWVPRLVLGNMDIEELARGLGNCKGSHVSRRWD